MEQRLQLWTYSAIFPLFLCLLMISCEAVDDTVLIRDTGSTNSSGYELTVNKSGQAVCVNSDWQKQRPPGQRGNGIGLPEGKSILSKDITSQFFADLNASMPLSKLPIEEPCIRSASFGSSTYIVYKGEMSPDIQCLAMGSRQLLDDYHAIINKIRKR